MKLHKYLRLAVILSMILFMGCNSPEKEQLNSPESLVLKSYQVPERLAKEIRQTMNTLLGRGEESGSSAQGPIGRALLAPDGQILISAPQSFHKGVEEFIERIKKNNPAPSPSAEVRYWIVAARKAEYPLNPDAAAVSGLANDLKNPYEPDELMAVRPALDAIIDNQGYMEFKLLDQVSVTSSGEGSRSKLRGAFIGINQSLTAYNDGTVMIKPEISWFSGSINVKDRLKTRGSINTVIETKSGEFVVIGQLSQEFKPSPFGTKKGEEEKIELMNVFYILSAVVKN